MEELILLPVQHGHNQSLFHALLIFEYLIDQKKKKNLIFAYFCISLIITFFKCQRKNVEKHPKLLTMAVHLVGQEHKRLKLYTLCASAVFKICITLLFF